MNKAITWNEYDELGSKAWDLFATLHYLGLYQWGDDPPSVYELVHHLGYEYDGRIPRDEE